MEKGPGGEAGLPPTVTDRYHVRSEAPGTQTPRAGRCSNAMNREPLLDLLAEPLTAPVWPVSELTAQVRETLEANPVFADLWVQGEVSSSHTSAAGHTYFTLQDGSSRLACVLFRRQGLRLDAPEQGRLYVVRGSLTVYEAGGQYQLIVSDHRPAGLGDLFMQFQRLKARLEAEGLFAAERKRPLPEWPTRIGVVTSAQGAALHDLCQVIGRRYPLVELVVAPSLVQGAAAPAAVVRALAALNAQPDLDFVIVARGGGSVEDLWAFNDERVARAIAASRLPVVSAVGHEVDFTITDGVADVRAPTPSAAGEMVVPDGAALARQVADLSSRLQRAGQGQVQAAAARLGSAGERLSQVMAARLDRAGAALLAAEGRLAALNPLAVLGRGYAIVRDAVSGRVRARATEVHVGDLLHIALADGTVVAGVTDVQLDADAANGQQGPTGENA